jgi:hypothetical protein
MVGADHRPRGQLRDEQVRFADFRIAEGAASCPISG